MAHAVQPRRAMRLTSFLTAALPLTFPLSACTSVEIAGPVSGTVIDNLSQPTPGARVQVGSTLVTTDAAGHFSIPSVESPYDVTLVPEGGADPYLYLGLTTHEPTLRIHDRPVNPTPKAQSTTLLLELPQIGGGSVEVGFVIDGPDDLAPPTVGPVSSTTPGQYPISIVWAGDATLPIRIQAFGYETDATTGAPKHYVGYDTADLDLANGTPATWNVSWKAPTFAESTLSVSMSLPDEYQFWESALALRSAGAARARAFAWASGGGPEISFVVPDLPGATFEFQVCAGNLEASSCRTLPGLTAGTKGIPLEIERGPTLLSPARDGSFGIGTQIEWMKQGEGAVFVLLFPQQSAAGRPRYYLATDGDSAKIPDLTGLGVNLPPGLAYYLQVLRNGAIESVDELAEKGPYYTPPDGASSSANSLVHQVTSQ